MTAERIEALRGQMRKRSIDMYLVPASDFHQSEYVGDYFKAREYLTGFTGSAGTAVITMTEAGLWTDGRYFIQAGRQLEQSHVTLYRMGEEGVPSVREFIEQKLPEGGCLGFDGRVVNTRAGEEYQKIADSRQCSLAAAEDLVGIIWQNRPQLPKNPVFVLEEQYSGESAESKLKRVREKMREKEADVHILTSLCDIAWLFNIRGHDIAHVPVVMSFAVITMEECYWFVNSQVLGEEVREYCTTNRILVKPYEAVYDYAENIPAKSRVLLDKRMVNYRIFSSLRADVQVLSEHNPTERMKAGMK